MKSIPSARSHFNILRNRSEGSSGPISGFAVGFMFPILDQVRVSVKRHQKFGFIIAGGELSLICSVF